MKQPLQRDLDERDWQSESIKINRIGTRLRIEFPNGTWHCLHPTILNEILDKNLIKNSILKPLFYQKAG